MMVTPSSSDTWWNILRALMGTGLMLLIGAPVPAQSPSCLPCPTEWGPLLGAYQGLDGKVECSLVFDDGSGPALYLGGSFQIGGTVAASRIVRWDGETWEPLGQGLDGPAYALAVHDDGSGPALYVGGSFQSAGGVPASNIARWDGAVWSALSSGTNGRVEALQSFDDGGGSRLFAGGEFTQAGGLSAGHFAAWDGSAWAQVGDGLNGRVYELCVADLGGGPELILSGGFSANGLSALPGFIARWDGLSFSTLGSGLTAGATALAVHDDGSGVKLWVSGGFGGAGGQAGAQGYATWDGASWSLLPSVPSQRAEALWPFDVGGLEVLVAGGSMEFPSLGATYWDGTAWQSMASQGLANGPVSTLATLTIHGEPRLVAAGGFNILGSVFTPEVVIGRIAVWDETSWLPVEQGLMASGSVPGVHSAAQFDDGSGPALFLAGRFTLVGAQVLGHILRYDGTTVSDLAGGLSFAAFGNVPVVNDMVVHDDGSGPALYVGGFFDRAGGVPATNIARWDGVGWSAVGTPGVSQVLALASYDDGSGSGPLLYAADVNNGDGSYIRRWDGVSWSDLPADVNQRASDLLVHDDGSGSRLYAGGLFDQAGAVAVDQVAAFDGGAWSALAPVGTGPEGVVLSLAVADLGAGDVLVVGGEVELVGATVGAWDGSAWTLLPGLNGTPWALQSWDDGAGGTELYAGGSFQSAMGAGSPRPMLARWTGTSWDVMEDFVSPAFDPPVVRELLAYDLGGPSQLLAGGDFKVSPSGSSYAAVLVGCDPGNAWCDVGFSLAGAGGPPLLEGLGSLAPGSANQVDLTAAAPSAIAGLFLALSSSPVPFKGGTLVPVPFLIEPVILPTSPLGEISLPFVMPAGAPPGTELWVQWAIQDGGAPNGVALSNALLGTTP